MMRPSFVCLLVFNMVAAIAAELAAQAPTPESIARRRFNQVFVKVIVPVTSRTPKQDGPVVESWVAEQLKPLDESEYFAVTDWVPVCDGLLADDIIDNDVWDGCLDSKHSYCHVGGDIPERGKTAACWLALVALRQAVPLRTSRWRMNLAIESSGPCRFLLAKTESRLRPKSGCRMWQSSLRRHLSSVSHHTAMPLGDPGCEPLASGSSRGVR